MKETYQDLLAQIDMANLPQHIGVIMDGNGRWAKARGQARSFGHKAGAEAMRRLVEICREIGIKSLSVYAFSTENWRRPEGEIDFLMRLLAQYLKQELPLLMEQNIRLNGLGDWSALPKPIQDAYAQMQAATEKNAAMTLNLAVNYGSQQEILRAMQSIYSDIAAQKLSIDQLNEDLLASRLDTGGQPTLDLIIRPSGEQRLSNFMLWQAAYAEFIFLDILWPDFGKRELLAAIIEYQSRNRRFGGLG